MNTEYVWWVVVLLLVGGGAIAFLALGRVPEIEDEPPGEPLPEDDDAVDRRARTDTRDVAGAGQSLPVSSTVSASDEPAATDETP
jgi:hypothetical protein